MVTRFGMLEVPDLMALYFFCRIIPKPGNAVAHQNTFFAAFSSVVSLERRYSCAS